MINHLGPNAAIQLINELRSAVRDLAARASKLEAEFHARLAKERLRHQAIFEEENRQLSAAQAEAEARFDQARAAIEDKYEARKSRVGKAYHASKDQRLKQIEQATDARKYELQKRMLQAERNRDAAIASANTAREEFQASLSAEQTSLNALEQNTLSSFRGYRALLRGISATYQQAQPDTSPPESRLLAQIRKMLGQVSQDLTRFQRLFLPRFFRNLPLWFVLCLCEMALAPLLKHYGLGGFDYAKAGGAAAASFSLVLILHAVAGRRAGKLAREISLSLGSLRQLCDATLQKSEITHQREIKRVKDAFEAASRAADAELRRALAKAGEQRVACRMANDEKAVRAGATNDRLHQHRLKRHDLARADGLANLRQQAEERKGALVVAAKAAEAQLETQRDSERHVIEAEWTRQLQELYSAIEGHNTRTQKLFPPWQDVMAQAWKPPERFSSAAKFGRLEVDVEKLCEGLPNEKGLALPGPARFELALALAYPEEGSLLFETADSGHAEAIGALNNIILRLLATAPPGKLSFTILDPVGLGQNFAGVMHLADYEEQIINNRIWTQPGQIEQRLADLNEHMEKVIQMYLRNEYASIADYNKQAGAIAEKYHFLVVADFPAGFTETAAKRLSSIAASGARCGVYMLLHWDRRLPLPQDFMPEELRKSCFCISAKGENFLFTERPVAGEALVLDEPPSPESATEFVHQVGKWSRDSSRVEVPFPHVAPPEEELWSEDTRQELRVPIGRTGATKLQYLEIGKGTRQHGLIAGKTGSGKSTLFHVIITNLSLWCSPEQVEFYLVDFKKGVEFKCYATHHLPHARVVAIESDREFGLSVLQRVDEELRHRGDLFRKLGAQDLAGYKRAGGAQSLPRCLLIIDEFQEFFVEDDQIAQTAQVLLDRIVRQGRAFGIHVLLGSQTLGGAYTVARTTLGQMVIRIALQCNEADAYLIMDETNAAPRLLSRPGEGIYNDAAGALEGNSPFQVVWLPDEMRETYLEKVRARAAQTGAEYPGPIVFEGNAPADVWENALLEKALQNPALTRASAGRIWLGAPNSIKGPTEAVFHRQSGNNLLMVGQRDEAALAMVSLGLLALAAQYPLEAIRLFLCDGTPPGTPHREFLARVLLAIPHPVTVLKPAGLDEAMAGLWTEMQKRADEPNPDEAPATFLFIYGLQKYGRLRYEEDFSFSSGEPDAKPANPAAALNQIICEGARLGFHVVATCDTYNNVNRFLSRKALSEFEMRVLFQMSPNDSASLIDNPKASALGLHRALYHNAQEGHMETFRPYALPTAEWLEQAARRLSKLTVASTPEPAPLSRSH